MRHVFGLVSAFGLLSACVIEDGASVPLSTTIAMASQATLSSRLQEMPQTETMPARTSGSYSGYLTANAQVFGSGGATVLAPVDLEVNFNTQVLSGSFEGVMGMQGEDISGSGTVSNGTISGTEFTADLDGDLVYEGQDLTLNGALSGRFLGAEADAMSGEIAGFLFRDLDPAGTFAGAMWAE